MSTIMPYGPHITIEPGHVRDLQEAPLGSLLVWDEHTARVGLVNQAPSRLDWNRLMILAGPDDLRFVTVLDDWSTGQCAGDQSEDVARALTERAADVADERERRHFREVAWADLREELAQRGVFLAGAPDTTPDGRYLTDHYRWEEDPAVNVTLNCGDACDPVLVNIGAVDARGCIADLRLDVFGPRRTVAVASIAGAIHAALDALPEQ